MTKETVVEKQMTEQAPGVFYLPNLRWYICGLLFFASTINYIDRQVLGLLKPVLFGYIIATVGCYYGLSAKGGTQGVGRATTQAVVAASVLILAVDLFVTRLLMVFLGPF